MGRGDPTDEEWARPLPYLPANGGRGGQWSDHRRVLKGIYLRERTGVPWRDLSARYGNWKTVYERHRRWSADGTWDRMLKAVQTRADEEGRLDWGKIHLAGEGGRRPLGLLITPGQADDGSVFEQVMAEVRVPRRGGGHPRTRPDSLSADKRPSHQRV